MIAIVFLLPNTVTSLEGGMDWYGGEMLLLGADMDEFRLEKNVKPDKVCK